ncbi:MAG: leucyl/phenylalanyl-tRNA--protein transferase [Chthonomonadaceae bacterium]|nr:leucyl/phenylalanyl-tRNA--protein transferase [Chthonomonadaceae bacterium]
MFLTLTPAGIEYAYRRGIFPMDDPETGELLWFQPDPRTIIPLDGFHISRSLAKTLKRKRFEIRYDTDFEGVMRGCADREETWISEEFIRIYSDLHALGKAHSAEVWLDEKLVGGTYGVAIGGSFMAESMFHTVTDASKVALFGLVSRLNKQGFALLDVQYLTPHLESLGAIEISHATYKKRLEKALKLPCNFS